MKTVTKVMSLVLQKNSAGDITTVWVRKKEGKYAKLKTRFQALYKSTILYIGLTLYVHLFR